MTSQPRSYTNTLNEYYLIEQLTMSTLNVGTLVHSVHSSELGLSIDVSTTMIGSIYVYSSVQILRYTGVMYLLATKIMPANQLFSRSINLYVHRSNLYKNAHMLSNELGTLLKNGINMTYVTSLISDKIKYIQFNCTPQGLGIVISGQLKGYSITRSIQDRSLLCLGKSTSRCIDIGLRILLTTMGIVGIKTAIWI